MSKANGGGGIDRFDALVNDLKSGLPAEIALRRKQYEYYRDKLLAFHPLNQPPPDFIDLLCQFPPPGRGDGVTGGGGLGKAPPLVPPLKRGSG